MLTLAFSGVTSWAILGTIKLVVSTYQDYKNNMLIDERHNYFMLGATIMLLSHIHRGILYLIGFAVVLPFFYMLCRKIKGVGESDLLSISWILLGLGIINLWVSVWFGIIFICITVLYSLLRFALIPLIIKAFKINVNYDSSKSLPFYPVILVSFVLINIMYGLY